MTRGATTVTIQFIGGHNHNKQQEVSTRGLVPIVRSRELKTASRDQIFVNVLSEYNDQDLKIAWDFIKRDLQDLKVPVKPSRMLTTTPAVTPSDPVSSSITNQAPKIPPAPVTAQRIGRSPEEETKKLDQTAHRVDKSPDVGAKKLKVTFAKNAETNIIDLRTYRRLLKNKD